MYHGDDDDDDDDDNDDNDDDDDDDGDDDDDDDDDGDDDDDDDDDDVGHSQSNRLLTPRAPHLPVIKRDLGKRDSGSGLNNNNNLLYEFLYQFIFSTNLGRIYLALIGN